MAERPKLDLQLNAPVEIQLLFDDAIVGSSQFGNYYLYAVSVGDKEYSYFPPESVHDQLKPLKKGDKIVITKLAEQKGSKLITKYDVKYPTKGTVNNTNATFQKESSNSAAESSKPVKDGHSEIKDQFYAIMLQSYKDAISINNELNGLAEPSKIAITLFIARSKPNGSMNGYSHVFNGNGNGH
jgi:hypothetical protein